MNKNILLFKLVIMSFSIGYAQVDQDFQSRCNANGVVICEGFDSPASFVYKSGSDVTSIQPAGDGAFRGTFDITSKASGAGSLRFEIPGGQGANGGGSFRQTFGRDFGPGSTFYVQWRQKFSTEMVTLGSSFGGGGWKQIIIHNAAATCAGQEITMNNGYYRGFPQMYSVCGDFGFVKDIGNFDYLLEQDELLDGSGVGYDCHYLSSKNGPNSCAFYRANEWMTFQIKVVVGDWGVSNSTVQAWVAYEGGPLKMIINMQNIAFTQDAPGRQWNFLTLLPYDTGKDGRAHATAYTWYDELIVATQPIAAPGGGIVSQPTRPKAPKNLRVE